MASRKKHFWKVIWSEVIHKSNNYYTPQNHMQQKKISSYTLLRILLTPTRIFTGGCTHSKIFHESNNFFSISFLTYYSLEILEKLRHIIDVKQYRDSISSRDPKWAPSISLKNLPCCILEVAKMIKNVDGFIFFSLLYGTTNNAGGGQP